MYTGKLVWAMSSPQGEMSHVIDLDSGLWTLEYVVEKHHL